MGDDVRVLGLRWGIPEGVAPLHPGVVSDSGGLSLTIRTPFIEDGSLALPQASGVLVPPSSIHGFPKPLLGRASALSVPLNV